MSNWYAFQTTEKNSQTFRSKRDLAVYIILSLVMIAAGSWLVLFLLDLSENNPFKTSAGETQLMKNLYFSPTVQFWEQDIQIWAEEWSVDPLLVATVMQIESCGNPQAISPAGAQGLFQVMPYHFDQDEDMLDPHTNARRSLAYLSQAFDLADGDIDRTLAGYNGGHAQINRDPELWPDETKRYVHFGAAIYEDAANGNLPGAALNAWLNAGGASLCQIAKSILGLD